MTTATGQQFSTCTGQIVNIDGKARLIVKSNKDGTQTVRISIHAAGTDGAGTQYTVNYQDTLVRGGPIPISFEFQHVVLVSKGSQPNQTVTFKFQVDPPVGTFTVECHG